MPESLRIILAAALLHHSCSIFSAALMSHYGLIDPNSRWPGHVTDRRACRGLLVHMCMRCLHASSTCGVSDCSINKVVTKQTERP